jgi:hypothetical protein
MKPELRPTVPSPNTASVLRANKMAGRRTNAPGRDTGRLVPMQPKRITDPASGGLMVKEI